MIFGTVCSGIGAPECAWSPLGWECAFMSEIEPFPRAVLAYHYPKVPLHGDFTTIRGGDYPDIDVLCGGTPCQSFSIAGLRGGLADARGNLALEYLRLAERLRPRWLVWENVPGVRSSGDGRDFGAFLGGLGELGYGWAYRSPDAQYAGLAQRRERVFVVGYLGDWRRAAAVLFEPASLRGDSPPSREKRQRTAAPIAAGPPGGSGYRNDADTADNLIAAPLTHNPYGDHESREGLLVPTAFGGNNTAGPIDVATACNAHGGPVGRLDFESETFVTHALRADGFDASEDGTGRGTPLVPVQPYTLAIRGRGDSYQLEYRQDGIANAVLTPNGGRGGIGVGAIAFDCKSSGRSGFAVGEIAGTQRAMGHAGSHENGGGHQAVPFAIQERAVSENPDAGPDGAGFRADVAYTVEARSVPQSVAVAMAVRRLTPRECERLQGFPDDYTLIPWRKGVAPDGPRYKALGNSMAVPVVRWIGERIADVERLNPKKEENSR